MSQKKERLPTPEEIEKELGDFLSKKFGGNVKLLSPIVMPEEDIISKKQKVEASKVKIDFNLKPEDLISYLDQFIVKQDMAKAILATKICTHYNRVKRDNLVDYDIEMVGRIKNNVLLIGPTGVGKTYMVKLIANKMGVPFVKGDATKFSETGYVGGDVEDLVRDLVKEADGDISLAQNGIIYIDEIDKIASNKNLIGADVSRAGVQRALLKPMEETDVELKVPHDPISMMQEIERFRRSGKRDKRVINTKNILFILSGAFSDLTSIISDRLMDKGIGFGAKVSSSEKQSDTLKYVKSEDLIEYGFESEFVGRVPVFAILEKLSEKDLFKILKNPNNPIILGKKIDFAAYGIQVKFDDEVLKMLAKKAFSEKTGARGLVSAIEKTLIQFEKSLPSTNIKKIPFNFSNVKDPEKTLRYIKKSETYKKFDKDFEKLTNKEKVFIAEYIKKNHDFLSEKHKLNLTKHRIDIISDFYIRNIADVGNVIDKIKYYYDEIKKMEIQFFKDNDINIVIEEEAVDYIITQIVYKKSTVDDFYKIICENFKLGLKLIYDRKKLSCFFISKDAFINPNLFIENLFKKEFKNDEMKKIDS